ncbi:MAG: UDP-2,3-diacylglucosamine diphosphatase LpxI [Bryobacterales bacterium]
MKYGLIAGGGRFPLMVLSAAKQQGHEMVVVAVKEETLPEIEALAGRCYWVSLGELSKLIEILQKEQITEAIMAGRVQHKRIFSSIRPDWKLIKLLASLPRKNTDSLIGGVAKILADEGIKLIDSTALLAPCMAKEGPNTKRKPTAEEQVDIDYGTEVARALAAYDIGQSVVICEKACVAVEAMEGTDNIIERAGQFSNGRRLTVVKVAKPKQDMRFDVPVVGPITINKMKSVGATALAVDAGKTLFIDRDELLSEAEASKIAILGQPPTT